MYKNENENYDYYNLSSTPEEKKTPKRKRDYGRYRKLGKRFGALVLAGAVLGGSAGLAFHGVTALTGTEQAKKTVKTASAIHTNTASGDDAAASQSLDVSDIASAAMPSIVSITNISVQEVESYYSMFGMGGSGQTQEVESAGSGIIIGQNDDELLIVTNNHVVSDATTLTVSFVDGSAHEAQIKGTDSDRDLAVIAVPLADISDDTMNQISIITIGDSDSLAVGEQVVAIGNALGYGQSVTTGIVSAKDRTLEEDSNATFIQTDAAINPGNSGGALLNMKGELVGINSAKQASTEVEGMGYAIPMTEVSSIVDDLMNRTTREKVDESKQASLGISGTDVNSETSEMYGIPKGVYVSEVVEGSAADQAGMKSGYVITAFDGTSVSTITELKSLLEYYAAGETVDVTVQVSDNGEYKEQTLSVTLGAKQTKDKDEQEDSQNPMEGIFER